MPRSIHPSLVPHTRAMQEAATRRRLEIAKILRDDPSASNVALAKALGVNRDTITRDRRIMVEELKQETLNETEQLRSAMVERLENLNGELEKHRKSGKLPLAVVREMHSVTRSLIELLGVRKPVVEKLEIKRKTVSFRTIVKSAEGEKDLGVHTVITGELREPAALLPTVRGTHE